MTQTSAKPSTAWPDALVLARDLVEAKAGDKVSEEAASLVAACIVQASTAPLPNNASSAFAFGIRITLAVEHLQGAPDKTLAAAKQSLESGGHADAAQMIERFGKLSTKDRRLLAERALLGGEAAKTAALRNVNAKEAAAWTLAEDRAMRFLETVKPDGKITTASALPTRVLANSSYQVLRKAAAFLAASILLIERHGVKRSDVAALLCDSDVAGLQSLFPKDEALARRQLDIARGPNSEGSVDLYRSVHVAAYSLDLVPLNVSRGPVLV